MNPANALDSIYFITPGENFSLSKDAMPIDKTIPLPIQKKQSDSPGNFKMSELTAEQVLSGILTVLAYDRHNEHLDYYRSILRNARPNIKRELSEAAILKTKNEDFELAEEIFLALKGFDPEDIAITLNIALFFDQRADSYRRSGLNDDANAYDALALENYKAAMEAEPPAPDAFFNAGFFYLKQRDFASARDAFESFLALTCDSKEESENAAYKKERAQEILDGIKNQNMDDVRFKNAYALISSGQEEKGLDEIREFLQHNPNVWNAWFLLGWGLRKMERYADAEAAFRKALEMGGSENAETYNEISLCLMAKEDFSGTKENLLKALSLAPENAKIISNLGFVALKEGEIEMARKYFSSVLEFEPNDAIAAAELAKLESGC
ncbi:MAG: tetratricopeptide repeat protein [Treponemataceae bacterium]|nr:tetratricopeptide repeat protein [Treponemataceae bacterium]